MRRMITTKQTNYINDLSKVAEKGFKVGTYPASIDSVGILDVKETVQSWIENKEVDFENHTVSSSAGLFFHYPELLEHYGLGDGGEIGYSYYSLDNEISIPESITTKEQLEEYVKSSAFCYSVNNVGVSVDEQMLSNDVANYSSSVQAIDFDGNNIIALDTLECQEGVGQEIVEASDPVGVNTLDVENLRVENLEASSGLGTKLYKHHVVWRDGGSADIISTISTQITNITSFNPVWNSLHNGYYESATYNSGPIIEAEFTKIIYFDYEEGIKTIQELFVSDTVTEL